MAEPVLQDVGGEMRLTMVPKRGERWWKTKTSCEVEQVVVIENLGEECLCRRSGYSTVFKESTLLFLTEVRTDDAPKWYQFWR